MPNGKINFFVEDIEFSIPFPRKTANWIRQSIKAEKRELKELNYIFCSDKYLQQINSDYLNHSDYTDIISFNNSENLKIVEGDIFISIERVSENAKKFGTSFHRELCRVIIHGALHLLGYQDKSSPNKKQMRKKEDAYLSLLYEEI